MTMIGVAGPRQPGPKYGQPIAPNLNVRQICPNCRSDPPNIIEEYSKGDLVCGDCGTILGDRIVDTRSEWRTFANDEAGDDPSRVGDAGNPLLSHHLETTISSNDGRSGIARDLQRAQARMNNQATGKTTTVALQTAFTRIAERCDFMHLPRAVTQRAQHVYKIADEARVIRGTGKGNEAAVIAACIIFACRDAGNDRSFPEVCKVMKISKKELGQVFGPIKAAVRAKQSKAGGGGPIGGQSAGLSSAQNSVEGMLARIENWLALGMPVLNAAKHVAAMASAKAEIDGRSPVSIAAGVLYFTVVLFEKEDVSAKAISEKASTSESTTKLVCKLIAMKLDDVIRPEWRTEFPKGYKTLANLGRVDNASTRASRAGTPSQSRTPQPATNGNGNSESS